MKTLVTFLMLIIFSLNLYSQGNGIYHQFDLEVDGLTREYTLYVPEGHDGNEPWPLVFLFHGFSTTFEEQRDISQMYLVADTAKFLIAYPQGLNVYHINLDITEIGWNVPDYFHEKQDDVLFVSKTIDDLISNPSINIDLRRIHATGYSFGGYFCFYLALELSNRIASISSVAGTLTDTLINYICEPVRRISVLHIYGTDDQVNINACNNLCMSSVEISEYWAGVNGCNAIADSTQLEDIDLDDNSTVTLFDYKGCDQETEVKLYRINGGGHTWPGGWIDPSWGLGALNNDINASAEIWNFFKRNPHPNPWVEIPDTAFLNALIDEGVDTNGDSLISYTEAEAITSLDVSGERICDGDTCWNIEIESLAGIEAFVNLDSLNCNFNNIGTMDISNLVGLKYLNTGFSCICGGGSNLTELDVSNNTELEVLLCHFNQLTSIDLSNNIYLKELDIGCNNLTSLNISNNTELEVLNCHFNQLTSIDVSNNIYLKELNVQRNDLTSLNISNNTVLVDLNLGDMPSLYEVCVWEGFPEDIVSSNDSPNVHFTADCSITGLNAYNENSTIDIFPNPTNNIINIEIENSDNATIEIYNVSGRLVFSKAVDSKVEKIDISGLSAGMYFIKVRQENNVSIEKLIVY